MDLPVTIPIPQYPQQSSSKVAATPQQDLHHQEQLLHSLRLRIKELKHEKNQLSAQFKAAKSDPAGLKKLRAAMAQVSADLKAGQQQRKSLEALIRSLQSPAPDDVPLFPARFCTESIDSIEPGPVSIGKIDDSHAEEWDTYVNKHPRASLYHHYIWRNIIEDSFGHDCHYYVARDKNGNICGVLPLTLIESRLFGNYGVSLPFFNYGGPLADSGSIMTKLMEAAAADPYRRSWQHLEYRSCDKGLELPCSERKVSMILRLPKDQDSLEQKLGSKVRAQYKQCSQHDPVLKIGGEDLVDDFYQVFSRTMRDLGTPVYSKTFFETIIRKLDRKATVVCVYLNRRPAAAACLLGFRDMLEIPWAAALRDFNRYQVNMWMYRQILAFAIDSGYQYFDFGRSTDGSGTYRFKKQWGALPLQHYWYYSFPPHRQQDANALPALNPDNPKYRVAIAAWKRLPLMLANRLGPHIVKNLP